MYPILAVLLFAATPEPGMLVATPATADRGEVRTGPLLTQSFELMHRGSAGSLSILGVETTCGCLKPVVSKQALNPGASTELVLAVNTLTQPEGRNTWRASVRYCVGDAGPFETTVSITATLVREVSVDPPLVAFSTATTATKVLTLTDRRTMPLAITSATTTSPHLKATLHPPETRRGAHAQSVELVVQPSFPSGEFEESLVLLTTDPTCRELRVPVKVTKRSASVLTFAPEAPEVRFARGQSTASVLVQVRSPGGMPVRVDRVECEHPAVRAKWPTEAGPVAVIRISVDAANASIGPNRAEMHVILAEPAGRVVRIPITWRLPE